MPIALRMLMAALVVGFASWLAGRFPITAGFIVALPLNTLLVLPFTYLQHGNAGNTTLLAKSIFAAVPVTLVFFLPFLFAARFRLSFWQAYALACVALCLGFFAHRSVARFF